MYLHENQQFNPGAMDLYQCNYIEQADLVFFS